MRALLTLHLALSVFNALLVAAPGLGGLAVLLVVAGGAIAPLFAMLYRLLSEVADADSITEAYGWELMGITAGVAVGSAVGGALATGTGPRAAFAFAAVATLTGALIGRARQGSLKTS